jgi:hypothetical protein
MKLCLLAFMLLLAAVPGWAEEIPAPATASAEPSTVEATVCFTGALMTPAQVESDPWVGAPEVMTSTRASACLACKEFVPTCQSPGQDEGKACGDGDPPGTCTCKRCNHTFGCFP